MKILRIFLLLSCSTLLAGCATLPCPVPTQSIVMVDRNGIPVDPTGNISCKRKYPCNGRHSKIRYYAAIEKDDYDKYIDRILAALELHPADRDGKKKILLFAHGGLNTQFSTIQRAENLAATIREAGYFPVFINWQSSLVSSYFNHLVFQRQGRDWKGSPIGWGLSPFYLAKDAGRAATRLVPVEVLMFKSDLQSMEVGQAASAKADAMTRSVANRPAFDIVRGVDSRTRFEQNLYFLSYAATIPTKIALSPLLDAFGTSSWEYMLRAAETPFRSDELGYSLGEEPPPDLNPAVDVSETNGGLNVFLARLRKHIAAHGGSSKYEVVLVAHSMGAILVNRVLRDEPTLPVSNIVYMAAACSIKDYEDTIFPYLRQHPYVNMYHLVLHYIADLRDRTTKFGFGTVDFPPRGSLLVWIDNFLGDPKTYRDRAAGRTVNLMAAIDDMDSWKDIVPRIHVREFNVGRRFEKTEPQHHGDFGRISFWNPDCWKTRPDHPEACYDSPRKSLCVQHTDIRGEVRE